MEKMIKKAEVHLEFLYSDMGDELIGVKETGPEGETVSYTGSKGAGSVSVEVAAEYGKQGRPFEPDYFVKLFKNITDDLEPKYGEVIFGGINFTCTDGDNFYHKV